MSQPADDFAMSNPAIPANPVNPAIPAIQAKDLESGMPEYGFEGDISSLDLLNEAMAAVEEDQALFATFDQESVDRIFREVAMEASMSRVLLAQYAVEDTGRGVVEDKVIKNHFASEFVFNKYSGMRTCGVVREDPVSGITEFAEPIGPIAGIIPVTNPTSTVIFKSLIALKTRNCVVFSPHPSAARSCAYAAELLRRAAVRAGAPANCIRCVSSERDAAMGLLSHPSIRFTLATGGPGIVGAVYRSGKPAIGVGPGNAPAVIDEKADLETAVSSIVLSKTFDNGMICASENSVVVVDEVYDEVVRLMWKRGCYVMDEHETRMVSGTIVTDHHLNPEIVGRSAEEIASLVGLAVPRGTVALVGVASEIGEEEPMSYEKLSPVIALYRARDFGDALDVAERMVSFGGSGHTAILYTSEGNRERIVEFQGRMPACKVLVGQPSALGAIGDVYNFSLAPSLTLGCGSKGGSSASSNVGPMDLVNIKTVAERRENMLWFKVPRSVYFKRGIVAEAMRDLRGDERAMIVTDKVMVRLGYADRVADVLKARGLAVDVYDEVTPDPTVGCIGAGVERMRSFRPDVVLALGGGGTPPR